MGTIGSKSACIFNSDRCGRLYSLKMCISDLTCASKCDTDNSPTKEWGLCFLPLSWAGYYRCYDQWNSVEVTLCGVWGEVIKQYTFLLAPLMFTFGTWTPRCKSKIHREIMGQCFLQQAKRRSQPRAGINYQTCKWMRLQMILDPHFSVFYLQPQTSYGGDKLFLLPVCIPNAEKLWEIINHYCFTPLSFMYILPC